MDAVSNHNVSIRLACYGCIGKKRGIELDYIQPGKPQQNAYVERFNRTVRYDWLAQHLFDDFEQMLGHATGLIWIYDHDGPKMAAGGITPKLKLAMAH